MLGLPYWVDDNGNMWSAREYTEKEAHNLSMSLINSTYNYNCEKLRDSHFNTNCFDSTNLSNSKFSAYCQDSNYLINCINCINCKNLVNSRKCLNNKPMKDNETNDKK